MARLQALLLLALALCQQATAEPILKRDDGRNSFELARIDCQETPYGWERTSVKPIAKAIVSIDKTKGKPVNRAAPTNCSRVSCKDNAGIWWCNHDSASKMLESYHLIADGVRRILWECPRTTWRRDQYIYGQAFNAGNWSVIVRQDSCEPFEGVTKLA
ncbi:hypothetical protein G6O67_000936 [Ophiocordyceps sinensis]|uniref:Uncharacterized protein n=1 Tax=Ophiocordyceps sinensis TaxID=72228 RepID=A0A8H4VAF8_9HYPO|nr:hypothetical protein G6O67_000936 [Ophiocordyceps sinensis]